MASAGLRLLVRGLLLTAAAFLIMAIAGSKAHAAGPCDSGGNLVACENTKQGSPSTEWDKISGGGPTIQGFATEISVNVGETVHFKINTPARSYRSTSTAWATTAATARARSPPSRRPRRCRRRSPTCLTDAATGLVDCGNWAVSATLGRAGRPPSPASTSRKLVRDRRPTATATSRSSCATTPSHSDILFQTSDTTWQAYNSYGGNSLYTGDAGPPAARTRSATTGRSPRAVRTRAVGLRLRRRVPDGAVPRANGYDVSYSTGVDADRRGALLQNHKVFMSVGHDEYWSGRPARERRGRPRRGRQPRVLQRQRDVLEDPLGGEHRRHRARRTARWSRTRRRTRTPKIDPPTATWTGTWRDPRFSPPADGGRPENALTGTIFTVNC